MKRILLLVLGLVASASAHAEDVISAGQPDAAKIAEYADNGVAVIIDLRGATEDRGLEDEAATVEAAGMKYVPLPITGKEAISFENARRLDELLEQSDGPVVVHCGSGNRVGALMALRASLRGASDEEALAVGEEYGMTRLSGVVAEVLQERVMPDVSPAFQRLVEKGESGGEIEPISITLSSDGALSKTAIQNLEKAGFTNFIAEAQVQKALPAAPNPPVLDDGGAPAVPTLWFEASYHNKADWFYQSWQVDAKTWITNGEKSDDPPLTAKRIVIWFTSICESRSIAKADTPELVMHEYWNNHNAPPPGGAYCVVDKPCVHTAVIIDGKSGYNGVCL